MRFAYLQARVRPAEYEGIPDVVNDPVSIVLLVVGVALQAVSLLMQPEMPKEPKRIGKEQLADQIGPSRFNQTTSFDGFASLVEYGKPVPIPFGKMGVGQGGKKTGGLVLAGSLVWSRAYSVGTYQRAKMLFTMGQWIPAAPQVRGVWLGTTSLSALGNSEYALYWKSQAGENRIKMQNRIAGTQGTPGAGDPDTQNETFIAPVDGTIEGPGFSMVYNPTSNSKFGQHSPIPNGSAYRTNWEVVSIPFQIEDGDDAKDNLRRERAKRIKIGGEFSSVVGLGSNNREYAGQPGVGRAYSTQMGLVAYAYEGQNFVVVDEKEPDFDCQLGMRVIFRIWGLNLAKELDDRGYAYDDFMDGRPEEWGISHEDINAAIDQRRIRADDLLVIGSQWMIGQTQWVVEERTTDIWRPEATIDIVLKNVSFAGPSRIGFAGRRAVEEPLGGYEGPWLESWAGPKPDFISDLGFNTKKHCGANFWSLCQYETATVRMIRDADTIEFGIRSVVWNQANGLCNFNALLKPSEMVKRDKADIQVSTPVMNRYFKRTSCFSIWVRPVAEFEDPGTNNPDWKRINQVYCVTGESPREMYNYIRIRPRTKKRYEFRFIPRTGSDIAINGWEGAVYNQLDANGTTIGEDFSTPYGDFRVTFTGNRVSRESILINREMVTRPKDVVTPAPIETNRPTAITNYAWSGVPGLRDWYKNAFLSEFLGSPFNKPVGYRGTGSVIKLKPRGSGPEDDGYIHVRIQATVNETSGPRHLQTFGTKKNWSGNGSGISFTVIDDSQTRGQWAVGDAFTIEVPISGGNPYRVTGQQSVSAAFSVSAVATGVAQDSVVNLGDGERAFELTSQVSDISHYDELTKSCDNGPEHEITYVVEAVSEADGESNDGIPQYTDLAMLGLSIKSSQQINAIEQPRIWVNGGVSVKRLTANDRIGVSNLFSDLVYYLLTNESQGVGGIVPDDLIDKESFRRTGLFLEQTKIHSNGVVEQVSNIREFVTEQASRHLCIFTIKNGVFGMQPALPIDSSNGISTGRVTVDQIFTKGNILEGSYSMAYKNAEERRETAYAVRYRAMRAYELPEEKTSIVKFAGTDPEITEDLDLTQFCDNEEQALMVARFALATRKFVNHSIEFRTTPEAVGVQPGGYIRVMTEEIAFDAASSLYVLSDLTFTSARPIADGIYQAFVYKSGDSDAAEREIEIKNQRVTDPTLKDALVNVFTLASSDSIYQVQEITIDENAVVTISAIVVPTESDLSSTVAKHTTTPSLFTVEV